MCKRKNFGSALVDYVIPTAVVGLVVGSAIYVLASEGKILNFAAASASMNVNTKDQMAIVGDKPSTNDMWETFTPGSFGGTSDTPVSNCSSGNCLIDYGDFLLNGLPENLSEFTQINGTSGGTESIAAAMEQIADQLVKDGKSEAAKDIQDFAKMLKLQAFFQKEEEKVATIAKNPTEYKALTETKNAITIPSNLLEVVPTYITDNKSVVDHLYWKAGEMKLQMKNYSDETKELVKKDRFSANISLQFDTVMENNAIPGTMKNAVRELYAQSDELNNEMRQHSYIAGSTYAPSVKTADYSPLTGNFTAWNTYTYPSGENRLSLVTNPQYNMKQDLITSLITQPNKLF